MSTTPDLPGPPETELGQDDDAMFDELAARAGAALRRSAPADGVRVIAARRRRQQARRAIVVGGIAVAALAGVLVIASNRQGDPPSPVDSAPDTLPATTVGSVPDTRPATTVDSAPDTPPATTVGSVPNTVPIMWPQSSIDEVRQAQELADAGDPAFTWQVDPRLTPIPEPNGEWERWKYLDAPGAEIVKRFLRDELGWEEFQFSGEATSTGDELRGLVYLRCAPGETNLLYPDDGLPPTGERCAPTIDELNYEAVKLDLVQPDRQGPDGIWMVSRSTTTRFAQANPSIVEDEGTAHLEDFLQARIDGEGAEGYVEVFYLFPGPDDDPLLYATTTGAPYERFEIERVSGPQWPYGDMDFTVRLFADGGETVVEQTVHVSHGHGRPEFKLSGDSTTENGQPPPEP